MRYRIASYLHHLAGRIHPNFDFRAPGISFTIETHRGLVAHDRHDQGCPLWYASSDYDSAHQNNFSVHEEAVL